MAPPPPMCLPFAGGSKPKRRLSWSSTGSRTSPQDQMIRHPSYSPTSTLTDAAESLTFHSDSEIYDEIPKSLPEVRKDTKGRPSVKRSNTMTGTKKSTTSSKWGYGWGVGKKQKEKEAETEASGSMSSQTNLPVYQPPTSPPTRSNTKTSQASRSTQRSHESHRSQESYHTVRPTDSPRPQDSLRRNDSQRSHASHASRSTQRSDQRPMTPGTPLPRRPLIYANDSSSTLVGSALERKMAEVDSIRGDGDTTERLEDLRRNMATHNLDY
ncbi:hypothetical protein DXG03_006965 [Asterophora parasitica]|uniref:Uncharacterized protein n=1 Tax=Asterophora parasitica TaxID=117018 RepID=A0A9P7KAE8_9AGAR|nr:hypothetical protein DXG03_006965 [Asterophora parasitica]